MVVAVAELTTCWSAWVSAWFRFVVVVVVVVVAFALSFSYSKNTHPTVDPSDSYLGRKKIVLNCNIHVL